MPESLVDLARAAVADITPAGTIGDLLSETREEDGTVTVRFASVLPGYPGWVWTASLATVEGEEPSVLETELMPGEGALLAPDWVPWSERLAEYKAAQAAAAEAGLEDESGDDAADDLDDDEDDDEDDWDEDDDEDR